MRFVLKGLVSLVLTVLGLVALALGALQLKPVRGAVRDELVSLLEQELRGSVQVDDLRLPTVRRLELDGLVLRDAQGKLVASVDSAVLRIDPAALLSGQVRVQEATVEGLWLDLGRPLESRGGLFDVLPEPSPEETAAPGPGFPSRVTVEHACIDTTSLRAELGEQTLTLQDATVCGAFDQVVDGATSIALKELRGSLRSGERAVARLVEPAKLPPPAAARPRGSGALAALQGELELGETMSVDAELGLRDVSARTLGALGIDASFLPAPADLDLRATGPLSELRVEAILGRPNAARPRPLAARLDGTLSWSEPAQELAIEAELREASYARTPLPRVDARLRMREDGSLLLEELRAREGDARVDAHGRLAPDGALRLEATASIPELSRLAVVASAAPELAGALRAEGRVELGGDERWKVDVDARLRDGRFAENRVRRLDAKLALVGALSAPRVDATLDAAGLRLDGRSVSSAHVEIEGGPDRYRVSGRASDGSLRLRGVVSRSDELWRGAGSLRVSTPEGPIAARVSALRVRPGRAVELDALRVRFHDITARADGTIGLSERSSDLRVTAQVADLAPLTQRFAGVSVPGALSLKGRVRGQLERPTVELSARYRDGYAFAGERIQASLEASADLARRRLSVELDAEAGSGARVAIDAASRWKRGPLSAERLVRGEHELSASADQVSLPALVRMLPEGGLPFAVDGSASLALQASGTLRDPTASLRLQSRAHIEADPAPLDIELTADYAESGVVANLDVDDRHGPLVDARIETDVSRDLLAKGPSHVDEIVTQSRWDASLALATRRLWDLPGMRISGREKVLLPWRVGLDAQLTHRAGSEPDGEVAARAQWLPPARAPGEDADCSSRARFVADLSASMREGRLTTKTVGKVMGREAVAVRTRSRAPIDRWFEAQSMELGPAVVEVQIERLEVGRLPVVCDKASGVVSARFEGSDLFDRRANLEARVRLDDFRFANGPRFDARVDARSDDHMLAVDAELREGTGRASVEGVVPISFRVANPSLCIHERQPVDLRVRFNRVEVQPLLSMVPGFANPSGHIDGSLAVSGSLAEPRANGAVELDRVSFTMPRIGQSFSRVDARAVLDGRTLSIPRARFEDRGGYAKFSTEITFESASVWHGRLSLRSDDFPLRNQGIYLGEADARATILARADGESLTVDADIEELSVQLTTMDLGSVQSLEPNPDIVFAHADEDEPGAEPADMGEPLKVLIRIETQSPVWVRRDDFALQLLARLTIEPQQDASPRVAGTVDVRRGFINLFGQSFDVERGRVTFTGADEVTPALEITATKENPGGSTTRVEVTGFVDDPQLAFFVDDRAVTAGEALAALTGRGDTATQEEASARQQLSSVALGMTMGLLSLGARREFGDWVPMLSFEQHEDETRVSAGIEADRIIPKFLRGFVRGAYVEGIVSTGTGADGEEAAVSSNGASGGVLLELLLPRDFVWSGQYGPGPRWSIDLDWRP